MDHGFGRRTRIYEEYMMISIKKFGRRTRIYEEYLMISIKQNLKANLDKKAFLV